MVPLLRFSKPILNRRMSFDLQAAVLISLAVSLFMFALRMRAPLGADEGYLWYGVQQLRRGRLPHRDFKSYEPGRYLWSAAISLILGTGLASLRAATHLFFALGLSAALWVLHRVGLDWSALAAAAVTLAAWSHPQHKQFEHGCLMLAWASQAWMLLQPSTTSFEIAFATSGAMLVFGFNLFLYACAALFVEVSLALALGWLQPGGFPLVACALAMLAAASPFLLMLASPRFARSFWLRRVSSVFARGSANLPLPKPWPWRAPPPHLPDDGRRRAFQWLFLALMGLPQLGLLLALFAPFPAPARAGLLAAAALAAFAAHHAASRADAAHVAQSIPPLLLLLLALAAALAPLPGALALAAFSAWMTWPMLRSQRASALGLPLREVGGLRIAMPASMSTLLDHALAHRHARRNLFVAPAYPALYAMLACDSPVYDTFCLYPADEASQARMLAALEASSTQAALVSNEPIDGREDLRFSHTHPRVWEFLHARFRTRTLPAAGADVFEFEGAQAVVGENAA